MVSLELNELNFDYIKFYIDNGKLNNFKKILESKVHNTSSECEYPNLEPWIQWPSFYTGLLHSEHNIFRLGDSVNFKHRQIWEDIESQASHIKVGAISPMNAVNRISNPGSLFLPDPWTNTKITADKSTKIIFEWIKDSVLNNATNRFSFMKFLKSVPFLISLMNFSIIFQLSRQIFYLFKGESFRKAIILDLLLYRLFEKKYRMGDYSYFSLFLNSAAHVQHHFAYSSDCYNGIMENPSWYTNSKIGNSDPLYEIYRAYDWIIARMFKLNIKFFISTGLSQKPNPNPFHQYRLKDIANFINKHCSINNRNYEVTYLMSRDIEISSQDSNLLDAINSNLSNFFVDGKNIFSIDQRKNSLFIQVAFNDDPLKLSSVSFNQNKYDFRDFFVHVSIENQIHKSIGYLADPFNCLVLNEFSDGPIKISTIKDRILANFISN